MARSVLAKTRLDQVLVAPGKIVVNGEHYPYDEHVVTIEEVSGNGHFVVVARPSRLERLVAWWRARREDPTNILFEGDTDIIGFTVDE